MGGGRGDAEHGCEFQSSSGDGGGGGGWNSIKPVGLLSLCKDASAALKGTCSLPRERLCVRAYVRTCLFGFF